MGFCDPAPDEEKHLRVRFLWHGRPYVATLADKVRAGHCRIAVYLYWPSWAPKNYCAGHILLGHSLFCIRGCMDNPEVLQQVMLDKQVKSGRSSI